MEPLGPKDPQQIGPYRLINRLGAGGMGRVYLGMSRGGRAVAVKVIHPNLAEDPAFVFYFRREAEAAKAVSGAFTASVINAGLDDVQPWLATVYVEGPSLAETVIEFGRLPAAAVWRLAGGLVEALQAVHACKLVHRDLKPANVLLAPDGPKVIDFGISRALEQVWTTIGNHEPVGTPAYMSPEQAEGGKIGPSSDVFSLASVIAYAATGRVLFKAGRPLAEMNRVINDEPDLSDLPPGLRDLVAGCLRKDPAERSTLEQLLDQVAAGSAAFPAAAPNSFWPRSLATFIRSRYDLTDPGGAQEPDAGDAGDAGQTDPEPATRSPADVYALVAASAPAGEPGGEPALAVSGQVLPRGDAPSGVAAGRLPGYELNPISTALTETSSPRLASPGLPAAPRKDPRKGRVRLGVGSGVALALVAACTLLIALKPGTTASHGPAAVSYDLPTESYSDGLVIKTRWTLDGSSLTEMLTATESTGAALAVQYQEPVPADLLTSVASARFTPAAPMIIDRGTGLVWSFHIPPHGSAVVEYQVTVAGTGASLPRLKLLLSKFSNVRPGPVKMAPPPVKVQSLSIVPRIVRLAPGHTRRLDIDGLLSNGKPAPAGDLSGVVWTTANRKVATISAFGKVTAHRVGVTRVVATIGSVSTFITVTVATLDVPTSGPYNGGSASSGVQPGAPSSSPNPPPSSPNSPPHTSTSSSPASGPTTLTPGPI